MLKRAWAVFLFCSLLGLPGTLLIQAQEPDQDPAYDISVSAISIAVSVRDKKGRFVDNLTPEDFLVYENDGRKEITYFKHDYAAPVSLTVLLDVSGSMALQERMKDCREALEYLLLYLLKPQDEVSLLIFADGQVEVAAPFSQDKARFLSVLARTEAYGQTALNDAVAVSPEYANRGKNEKRALLLLTDGVENDSQSSPDQAVEIARRVDVPIYIIGYRIPLGEQQLQKLKAAPSLTSAGIVAVLDRFSEATGGKAFFIERAFDLFAAMREIKKELSHQYIIGYTSYRDPEESYRNITVLTKKKNYRVRTRKGY